MGGILVANTKTVPRPTRVVGYPFFRSSFSFWQGVSEYIVISSSLNILLPHGDTFLPQRPFPRDGYILVSLRYSLVGADPRPRGE